MNTLRQTPILMSLLATLVLLAGCVVPPPPTPVGTVTVVVPTITPTNTPTVVVPIDHSLVIAFDGSIISLNPPTVTNEGENFLVPLIYESLLTLDREGNLQGALAKTWKVTFAENPPSATIRFELDPDAKFQDGTPVTSESIRDSLDAGMELWAKGGPNGCQPPKKTSLTGPPELKAEEDHVLDITIGIPLDPGTNREEYVDQFLRDLTTLQVWNTRPDGQRLGTGPFNLEYATKAEIVMQPNPFYGAQPPSPLDQIKVLPMAKSIDPAILKTVDYGLAANGIPGILSSRTFSDAQSLYDALPEDIWPKKPRPPICKK